MKKLIFCFSVLCVLTITAIAQEDSKPGAFPAWSKGRTDAPVTIEVFNSFSCKYCVELSKTLDALMEKYPWQIQVVYRQYPLKGEGHENARAAAQAREAAGVQGKFFEMTSVLVEKQDVWRGKNPPLEEFVLYAKSLELDVESFRRDYDSAVTRHRINLDIERGISFKLNGTPSVILNGKLVSNAQTIPIEILEEKIKDLFAETKR